MLKLSGKHAQIGFKILKSVKKEKCHRDAKVLHQLRSIMIMIDEQSPSVQVLPYPWRLWGRPQTARGDLRRI